MEWNTTQTVAVLAAILFAAISVAGLAAAATSYTIDGTVTDGAGTNVSGATVTAYDSNGTVLAETTTASDGTYSLSVNGSQEVRVEVVASGYVTAETTYSSLSEAKTYSPTLKADSDGDGIADADDSYPSYPVHEYTVTADDNKTVSSLYAEINSTNEVTVTVLANGTELASNTVTPSTTPETVEVNVTSTYSEYTVSVHGVDESNVSSTGVFYESADSGGAGGDGSSSDLMGTIENNPVLALVIGIVGLGAVAVIREEL